MNPPAGAPTLGQLLSAHGEPFKGLLVLLVVADHNEWLRHLAPDLFKPLTFHVLGFLLLGFAFAGKGLSWSFVQDRACRYLVPFWWMLALTATLYGLVVLRGKGLPEHVANTALAAIWGNAPFVKTASGFLMLWYLPCMFGLSVVLAALHPALPKLGGAAEPGRTERRAAWSAAAVWAVAAAAHLLWPVLPARQAHWLPFGLSIVAQLLLLGLVWRWLLGKRLSAQAWAGLGLCFVASYGTLVSGPVNLELATLDLYGIDHPQRMVLQDLAGLSGVLLVVGMASRLGHVRWLQAVGRHSLLVYLLHPLVYQVLVKLPGVPSPASLSAPAQLAVGLASGALAAAVAWGASVAVGRSARASAWLVPRGWADWPPTARLARNSP